MKEQEVFREGDLVRSSVSPNHDLYSRLGVITDPYRTKGGEYVSMIWQRFFPEKDEEKVVTCSSHTLALVMEDVEDKPIIFRKGSLVRWCWCESKRSIKDYGVGIVIDYTKGNNFIKVYWSLGTHFTFHRYDTEDLSLA